MNDAELPRDPILDHVIEELRNEPPEEVDFDSVERKLFARIDAHERTLAARKAPSPFARGFALAAAAAAIAFGVRFAGGSPAASPRSATPIRWIDANAIAASTKDARRPLESLAVGDGVETTDAPVRFAGSGLQWTLFPHSRLVVRTIGEGHTVTMERGSIEAEVEPRGGVTDHLAEAFAVEVEGTRVAVHGTHFRVTREADGVLVEVMHGVVAIGPVGHRGPTTGRMLVGPARASFSFDGGLRARLLSGTPAPASSGCTGDSSCLPPQPIALAPQPVSPEPAAPLPLPPSSQNRTNDSQPAKPPAPLAAAELPQAPALEPPHPPRVLTRADVQAGLRHCFNDLYGSRPSSVRVSVSSTLTLFVREDGSVETARFFPPLESAFQTCAFSAVSGGRFEQGSGKIEIPFVLGP